MDIVKYDWRLSGERPFVYDWQQYSSSYSFPGYDMHGDVHLLIMLKGTFCTDIGGSRFACHAGDLVLIAPWELHGNYSVEDMAELLSITVFCSSLRSGLSSIAPWLDALLQLPPQERMRLLQKKECIKLAVEHAQTLIRSSKSISIAEDQRLEINDFSFNSMESAWEFLRIQQLFAGFLQYIGNVGTSGGKRNLAEYLAPALRLLEDGSQAVVTTARAAQECNLSSGYFNTVFKKIYGISFYTYELKYRLRRAETDLRSGQYSIKEIAQKHGFADASHFSRTFKRYYASAPSCYLLLKN